ncbi:Putative LOC100897181, partial [Caligus rogercresseyi]
LGNRQSQETVQDPKLLGQLVFIKGKFTQLVRDISSLQERFPLTENIGILEMVQMQLTVEPFPSKLKSALEKNPDSEKNKFFSRILKTETLELKDDPKLPFLFSCAPITSVDCERASPN